MTRVHAFQFGVIHLCDSLILCNNCIRNAIVPLDLSKLKLEEISVSLAPYARNGLRTESLSGNVWPGPSRQARTHRAGAWQVDLGAPGLLKTAVPAIHTVGAGAVVCNGGG